ncbi:MAG: hypothetical protein D4R74_00015 [Betaproteobacteria bacterium]|nr:MAG: hypothetical protein D4R74_00015 [Betaproteobacteria bacterium]
MVGFLFACMGVLGASTVLAQSWSPASGDFQGGLIRGLYVPNPGTVGDSWAAVYYGGMFKQASGSGTWVPMNTGLADKRVYTLSVNAGVSPYRGYAASRGGGIYKTTDGGANWTLINNGLGCVYPIGLQVFYGSTQSTDRLFASTSCASNSGVYVSNDGGANWALTGGMAPGVTAIGTTRVNPSGSGLDFMLASTYDGLYKSTDSGLNWTLFGTGIVNPNGSSPNLNGVTVLYNATAGLALFTAEANSGVWRSTDQGVTWTLVKSGITTSAGVGSDGTNLYFPVDGEGVYISADRGTTWTMFASNAVLPGARSVQRYTATNGSPLYYAQTYAGVYQSTDGVTWNKMSVGLPGGYTINANTDSSSNAYLAAAEGVFKAPGGGTFQRLGGYNIGFMGNGGHVIVTPADVPYAITSSLGVFRFDGTNWVAKNAGLPNLARNGSQLRSDPNSANGLFVGFNRDGVYYSADGGDTWAARNTGLTGDALHIRSMAPTPSVFFMATNDGLYKSTNSGVNWARVAFPAKSPGNVELNIDHLRIDSGNGNIYAAVYQTDPAGVTYSGSGIWKSTDGGSTWTQSLAGKQAHEVAVARTASGVTLYAGLWDVVGGGAMQSTDEGATWSAINSGLTSNFIANFGTPGSVLKAVFTYGDGVLRFTPPAPSATVGIVAGWNLVGNGMGTPLTVASAFGDTSKVNTVWKWVPSTSKWAFYTPSLTDGGAAYAAGKGYDFLTTIAPGEGFWVNGKAAISVPLTGAATVSGSFGLMPSGWSLIAIGDSKTPSQFNTALSITPPSPGVIPINLTTLWAWDATLLNWYFYAPSLEANNGLAAYITSKSYLNFGTNTLGPTTGFWVNRP